MCLDVRGRGVDGLGKTNLGVLEIVDHIGISQEGVTKEGVSLRVGVGLDSKATGRTSSGKNNLLGSGSDDHSVEVKLDRHV